MALPMQVASQEHMSIAVIQVTETAASTGTSQTSPAEMHVMLGCIAGTMRLIRRMGPT